MMQMLTEIRVGTLFDCQIHYQKQNVKKHSLRALKTVAAKQQIYVGSYTHL